MHTLVPRIFIPSYPGYSYIRAPDIHTLVPRIFIPSYPGYTYPNTPDMHTLVPRIFIPSLGTNALSDAIISSPILAGSGGGAGGRAGGSGFAEYGGVDYNADPELALVFRGTRGTRVQEYEGYEGYEGYDGTRVRGVREV